MTKNEEPEIGAAEAGEQEEAKEQQSSSADVLELGANALQWIGEALSNIDIDLNF
ncbi:hypothetical protein [Acinetobacter sp. WCHAc010034]|uniref:hypothetical protein n=1 Tax=Acinetobacter sp. WCHAc010034 TaxID=1879049 RepID=UPI0013C2F6FB|nr:hypothetical protein [Acinetobacter sp. WCHAc010034]